MAKEKYNYRFVLNKDSRLYSLVVVKRRSKRQVLVRGISNFYTIGNYIIYRKWYEDIGYMRKKNGKTEICLGHAQSICAYFSYKDNGRTIVNFFNQHGIFVSKSYYLTGLADFEGKKLFIGYQDDGYCDVYVIKSGASYDLKDCHLEEFIPDENITIRDSCYSFQSVRYDKKKKCWRDAEVGDSWLEKFMNWLVRALS